MLDMCSQPKERKLPVTTQGLIFDLDGVLVHTIPTHYAAWARMFHEYGYDFDIKIYRDLVDGRLRFDGARAVMRDQTDATVTEAANKKNRYYLEMIEQGEFKIFEEAVKYVRMCKAQGYKLAAASSSANVRHILEKIEILDCFDVVIGGHQVTHGKPNPEIFLKAASELKIPVENCIVFEDSESGVQAAKNGGFYCVGVLDDENVADLTHADIIVSSVSEMRI
jgi:beta-phosphoglucomutase family hydrolase